jgi:hypothetical protein
VNTYFVYVHDDRYTVPNLSTLTAASDEEATELAWLQLVASPHHRMIELFRDERLVDRVARLEDGLERNRRGRPSERRA